jgi:hypothetical protein
MHMPTMARARLQFLLLLAGVTGASSGIVGCAGDTTAPAARTPETTQSPALLSPTAASHALVGVVDGVYTFTIDPARRQSLSIGSSRLDIPERAICRLTGSGYGPSAWDDECKPERGLVTITAVVRNAQTDHPRIDFEPALRFAPEKVVVLSMTLDEVIRPLDWATIFYCRTAGTNACVDESIEDPTLTTRVHGKKVIRRVKHFSGYMVES